MTQHTRAPPGQFLTEGMMKYVFEVECDGDGIKKYGLDLEDDIYQRLFNRLQSIGIRTDNLKVTDITNTLVSPGQYPLTFEKFWTAYRASEMPYGSKRSAFKQWMLEGIDRKGELFLDSLIEHIEVYAKRYHECQRLELYYPPLPHAERFLKKAMWETPPTPMPPTPVAGRPDGLKT